MSRRTNPAALAHALRCQASPPLPLQRLLPALERQQQTKLRRAMLEAGHRVRVGVLSFQGSYSDEEAAAIIEGIPHHWMLRIADGLWAQEVTPGADSDPALLGATT
jgi:2-methylcitrate dehydratase PrpD